MVVEQQGSEEEGDAVPEALRAWVFPSRSSVSGHVGELQVQYEAIGLAGGQKFWFQGLRNAFITVVERELMLPRSLTKRLVNHARSGDVTEGYATDRTVEQLREATERIADRTDEQMKCEFSILSECTAGLTARRRLRSCPATKI